MIRPAPERVVDAFLLGAVDASAVQTWIYQRPELEALLGVALHHELMHLDYRASHVDTLARRLLAPFHEHTWPGRHARLLCEAVVAGRVDLVRACTELTRLGAPIDWIAADVLTSAETNVVTAHRDAIVKNAHARIADLLVEELELKAHPEGGSYKETYRAAAVVVAGPAFERVAGDASSRMRSASTAILFLLRAGEISALHRIRSDEVWHFYGGDPLEVIAVSSSSSSSSLLRIDVLDAGAPQLVVPAGRWFGSRVVEGGAWSLVGCTVAPGFDFADFEMAARDALTAEHPLYAALIASLTRA